MNKEQILKEALKRDMAKHFRKKADIYWYGTLPNLRPMPLDEMLKAFDDGMRNKLQTWADNGGDANIALIGDIGVGKTTAAISLCDHVLRSHRKVSMFVKYQHLPEIRLGKNEDISGAWQRMLNCDILIVDDIIGSYDTKLSEWRQETLYELFDHRHMNQLPTILTSNLSKDEYEDLLGDRIIDRFNANKLGIKMTGGSKR